MSQNVTELTAQQHQVIELLQSGRKVGDIADQLGIERRTIWRWRQLPAFQQAQAELMQMRHAQYHEQLAEIVRLALVSVERKLQEVENTRYHNPFAEAMDVLKLLQPARLLASPASAEAKNSEAP